MSLRGKIAVVSGAARGLGREIARELAEAGCHVAVCDLMAPDARWATALARSTGVTVAGAKVDVSDVRSLELWLQSVLDRFGSVDVAVSNAGVQRFTDPLGSVDGALVDYAHHVDVNARAAYVMGRSLLPGMLERGQGTIVLMSCAMVRPADGIISGSAITDLHDASRWAQNGLISRWGRLGAERGVRTVGLALGACNTAARRHMVKTDSDSAAGDNWLDPAEVAVAVHALVNGGPNGVNLALWHDPARMSLPSMTSGAARGPLGTMRASGLDLRDHAVPKARNDAASPLAGRRALVSGGATAFGESISRALALAGADVIVCDHDPSVLAVGEGIEFETNRRVLGMVGNVSKPDDVERLIDVAVRELGGLDVLVNAAWVDVPTPLELAVTEAATGFDRVFAGGVLAALSMQRTATPHLVAAGGGDIINVTTTEVLGGGLAPVSVDEDAVGAANWATNGFTQAWALALASSRIRVNAVALRDRRSESLAEQGAVGAVVAALVGERPGRTGETIACGPVLGTGVAPDLLPAKRRMGESLEI